MPLETLSFENNVLTIIDQTRLPGEFIRINLTDLESCAEAIETLRIRGAPAIGVAAAYSVIVGLDEDLSLGHFEHVVNRLRKTRPTAVNLFHALDDMEITFNRYMNETPELLAEELLNTARRIHEEDRATCRQIGKNGARLLEDGMSVLTHCNAGGLATSDYGTALGVIYAAKEAGKTIYVYSNETRPLLQGSRLTAWELDRNGVDVTVLCDNMAAVLMTQGKVDCVIVGADRIAANGDTANKIGTYGLAVLSYHHNIPFYVAAPLSTFDPSLLNGNDIPIEERHPEEINRGFGTLTGPENIKYFNPAFDVTPEKYISAFITEKGIIRSPYSEKIKKWFE